MSRLLKLAEAHLDIFSEAALRKRKRRQSPNAHEWLDDYVRAGISVQTAAYFKHLQSYVKARRSAQSNEAAIAFYRRHGWQIVRAFPHEKYPVTMLEMLKVVRQDGR